ncbi:MAG: hypothetical protein C4534_07650 [Gaiellales bacterium]|nr:MAG: hypothetical protein C4534_07650 [Gaiellales bacterium]
MLPAGTLAYPVASLEAFLRTVSVRAVCYLLFTLSMRGSGLEENAMRFDICTRFESIPTAIIGKARADGCHISHRTSYVAHPIPAGSLAIGEGRLEWKEVDPDGDVDSLIYRFDNGILEINIVGERVLVRSYAASDGEAEALLELAKEHIRPMELAEDVVPVTFWRNLPKTGARPTTRNITSPRWEDIS